jgi:hypothetical protein
MSGAPKNARSSPSPGGRHGLDNRPSCEVWIGIGLGGLLAITCALLVGLVISVLRHL